MSECAVNLADVQLNGSAHGQRMVQALRRDGYAIIECPGREADLIDSGFAAARALFAQSIETKLSFRPDKSGAFRGYQPFANQSLSNSYGVDAEADPREGYVVNRPDITSADPVYSARNPLGLYDENVWPDDGHGLAFRPVFESLYLELSTLARDVLRLLATEMTLPPDWFDSRIDRHFTNFACYRYCADFDATRATADRGAPHTDFGTLSFVMADSNEGGLEVSHKGQCWTKVPLKRGAIALLLGEVIEQWTGGLWPATLHRVGRPSQHSSEKDRVSLVFFHVPNFDCEYDPLTGFAPPGYVPTGKIFGEHMIEKMTALFGLQRNASCT